MSAYIPHTSYQLYPLLLLIKYILLGISLKLLFKMAKEIILVSVSLAP